ncbi:response regulator transcription factor [Garciella nitratireducens]|uniref:Stage 0 sporulation protein A homolog n=1 Tax=Garciella nitratireducens DSM 15102 TaxID=1121911 RepID=A0A1T4N769_9FIRM|nr:response regulator transcription factor [Garciella nitratireducens]SJZ74897.1 DNA-binding response regulator, OmpR family, contains REC and winged-helix (wHTH) domain [Garciella nitratireducens DSM 15102]
MYKILIVEDDRSLCNNIEEGIAKWGFDVVSIESFENVLEEFAKHNPHLVIMDINLPCFDGFYWCRRIRDISKVPIIFLSSRDSNMDIVMAVNMGGDDYVTKPFSMDILLAKIQALFRRTYSYGQDEGQIIECNGAILNINDGTLTYNNTSIELTKNEFKILQLLMRNQGKIVARDRIMRALWESEYFISENTLTVNINRLRKRLEDIELVDFIVTKKSQGYMIP